MEIFFTYTLFSRYRAEIEVYSTFWYGEGGGGEPQKTNLPTDSNLLSIAIIMIKTTTITNSDR